MSFWGSGILTGLKITFKNLVRGPITVRYPHEKLTLPERARWAVTIKRDADGSHRCTACLACEKACPDHIIKIDVAVAEDRTKRIERWNYQIGACMMCGLCVEACPFDAIEMGHDYELAVTDPQQLARDLIVDEPARAPRRERPEAPSGGAERTTATRAPADGEDGQSGE